MELAYALTSMRDAIRCSVHRLVQTGSGSALLRLLGLRTDTFTLAAVPALGATAVLYAGPLLMALLDRDPAAQQARIDTSAGHSVADAATGRGGTTPRALGRVRRGGQGIISRTEALRRVCRSLVKLKAMVWAPPAGRGTCNMRERCRATTLGGQAGRG